MAVDFSDMKRHVFNLFPNLQFIYELHLAEIETAKLAKGPVLGEDFRCFLVDGETDTTVAVKRSAYVAEIDGHQTDYFRLTRKNVTRAFNQYITHWFYPYKGKYHPQMVRALANIMGLREGDTLLDPFLGSGTTAVEGALLGLKTIGFDISPLCVLISAVKANAVHHLDQIQRKESATMLREERPLTWRQDFNKVLGDPIESFELLARMIAKSDEARRHRDYWESVYHNRHKMVRSIELMKEGCDELGIQPQPARVEVADARKLPLADATVDGVITSPPYSIALNYVQNDAHALEALGYDLGRIKEEFIGVRGNGTKRFDMYEEDMGTAYREIARVLKARGKASVVLGNVTFEGKELDTVGNCVGHCERHGLRLIAKIDKLIYGLYNIMQREWILIFEKGA